MTETQPTTEVSCVCFKVKEIKKKIVCYFRLPSQSK